MLKQKEEFSRRFDEAFEKWNNKRALRKNSELEDSRAEIHSNVVEQTDQSDENCRVF